MLSVNSVSFIHLSIPEPGHTWKHCGTLGKSKDMKTASEKPAHTKDQQHHPTTKPPNELHPPAEHQPEKQEEQEAGAFPDLVPPGKVSPIKPRVRQEQASDWLQIHVKLKRRRIWKPI